MDEEKIVLFVSRDREAFDVARKVFDAAQNYRLIGCDDEITATKKLEAMNFRLILCDEAALVLANTNFLTLARAKEPHARISFLASRLRKRGFQSWYARVAPLSILRHRLLGINWPLQQNVHLKWLSYRGVTACCRRR